MTFVPAACWVWNTLAPNPDWSEQGNGAFMMYVVAQALVVDENGYVEVTEETAPYGQQPLLGWIHITATDTHASMNTKVEAWAREATGISSDVAVTFLLEPPPA